ncbi:MAG: hypothetical protein AAFU67_18945, partial [Bacteroidota bacterium]
FTLTGLTSDGVADIDVTATFATTTSCTDDLVDAYSAPVTCIANCIPPSAVSAFAIQASCTAGIVDASTAYLQISAATNATHYSWSIGNTYDENAAVGDNTMNAIGALPLDSIGFTMIDNPTGSEQYTIRIFNGASNCFTDVTVTLNEQDCVVGCDCQEYIYLNDTRGSAVHKFSVEPDSTLTEIVNNGGIWYPGNGSSELSAPHGLGADLNGFLYIAETKNGDMRKLTCEGELLPTQEFEVPGVGGFNFGSIGNLVFANDETVREELEVIDACSGAIEGTICFENQVANWGMYIDPRTEIIYTTSQFAFRAIYKATVDDINSGMCVAPFLTSRATSVPKIMPGPLDGKKSSPTFGT